MTDLDKEFKELKQQLLEIKLLLQLTDKHCSQCDTVMEQRDVYKLNPIYFEVQYVCPKCERVEYRQLGG